MDDVRQLSSPGAGMADRTRTRLWMELLVAFYALGLVVASITLFMLSTTAQQVGDLITEQNAKALDLRTNLEYFEHYNQQAASDTSLPPGLFDALIMFSRGNGQLMRLVHALRLWPAPGNATPWEAASKHFPKSGVFPEAYIENKPFDHYGINTSINRTNIVDTGWYQIELYQLLRDYAQNQSNYYKWFLGAVTTYALPVFYALLGAILHALRSCAHPEPGEEMVAWSDRCSRFAMAAIAGIAIGLFPSLIITNASLSPLALAFLVGYSIEALTSRLDRMLRGLAKKGKT